MTATTLFARSVAANVRYWRERSSDLQGRNLRVLDRDRHNLFRAAEFGLRLRQTWRDTVELVLQSFDLIEQQGYWHEWIPILKQALASCPSDDLDTQGRLMNQLGTFYQRDRQLAAAIDTHLKEVQVGLSLGDDERLARAHLKLSVAYRHSRRYEEAQDHGQAALDILSTAVTNVDQLALAYGNLGLLLHARGNLEAAEQRLRQAVMLLSKAVQPHNLARWIMNLAITLEAAGDVQAALQHYEEAKTLFESTNSDLDLVRVEHALGTLYFNQGRLVEAEAAFLRADSPFLRRSGHLRRQAITANNLGNVYLAQGRFEEAERCLRKSVELWRQIDAHLMLANSLGTLAESLVALGRCDQARQLYEEAIKLTVDFPEDPWGNYLNEKFAAARKELRLDVKAVGGARGAQQ